MTSLDRLYNSRPHDLPIHLDSVDVLRYPDRSFRPRWAVANHAKYAAQRLRRLKRIDQSEYP